MAAAMPAFFRLSHRRRDFPALTSSGEFGTLPMNLHIILRRFSAGL